MIGCLLIHGFTGSPNEVEPLARHLENQGIRVVTPLLAGHGGDREAFRNSTWKDWIASAEEALIQLMQEVPRIQLIGFSMGGVIAAHLATRYEIERLVLLSPAIFTPNIRQLISDFVDAYRSGEGWIPERFKGYAKKFTTVPIKPVIQFRKLVRNVRKDIPNVRVPTLIIHGNCDEVVHPRSARFIYDTIQSNEKLLHFLPKSRHIVCHDEEQDLVKELVLSFLPCGSHLKTI